MTVKNEESFVIPGKESVKIQEDCLWENWRICCYSGKSRHRWNRSKKRMEKAVLMKLTMTEPSLVDDY